MKEGPVEGYEIVLKWRTTILDVLIPGSVTNALGPVGEDRQVVSKWFAHFGPYIVDVVLSM